MMGWRGVQGGKDTLAMVRFTDNLFFWASELWIVCWHFPLAALHNLWMMHMALLRTCHLFAFPVCRTEPHVFCKGHIPTSKMLVLGLVPFPWALWVHTTHGFHKRWVTETWKGLLRLKVLRNPMEGVIWWSETSSEAVNGALSWKNWWIFVAFRKLFGLEKFWKSRQDLSLPKVLLCCVGWGGWNVSQLYGLKLLAKVTARIQFVTTRCA